MVANPVRVHVAIQVHIVGHKPHPSIEITGDPSPFAPFQQIGEAGNRRQVGTDTGVGDIRDEVVLADRQTLHRSISLIHYPSQLGPFHVATKAPMLPIWNDRRVGHVVAYGSSIDKRNEDIHALAVSADPRIRTLEACIIVDSREAY